MPRIFRPVAIGASPSSRFYGINAVTVENNMGRTKGRVRVPILCALAHPMGERNLTLIAVCSQRAANVRMIAAALSQFGAVLLHTPPSLVLLGEGEVKFLVEWMTRPERLEVPGAVLVLCDQGAPRRLVLRNDTIVVAGANDRWARRLMQGRENAVITCGTGMRDTLTVSSIEPERLMLCLQRTVPTAQGGELEPCEAQVQVSGINTRTALLCAGTLAACGCELVGRSVVLGE